MTSAERDDELRDIMQALAAQVAALTERVAEIASREGSQVTENKNNNEDTRGEATSQVNDTVHETAAQREGGGESQRGTNNARDNILALQSSGEPATNTSSFVLQHSQYQAPPTRQEPPPQRWTPIAQAKRPPPAATFPNTMPLGQTPVLGQRLEGRHPMTYTARTRMESEVPTPDGTPTFPIPNANGNEQRNVPPEAPRTHKSMLQRLAEALERAEDDNGYPTERQGPRAAYLGYRDGDSGYHGSLPKLPQCNAHVFYGDKSTAEELRNAKHSSKEKARAADLFKWVEHQVICVQRLRNNGASDALLVDALFVRPAAPHVRPAAAYVRPAAPNVCAAAAHVRPAAPNVHPAAPSCACACIFCEDSVEPCF